MPAPHAASSTFVGIIQKPSAGVRRLLAEAARHPVNPLGRPADALIGSGRLLLRARNVLFFAIKAAPRRAITGSRSVIALQPSAKSLSMPAQPIMSLTPAPGAARKTQSGSDFNQSQLVSKTRDAKRAPSSRSGRRLVVFRGSEESRGGQSLLRFHRVFGGDFQCG